MILKILGEPIAQIRMKYSGRHGIGRIYDPREKAKRELKAWIGKNYHGNKLEHPRISFIFHMPIPKSIPKKLIPKYQSGFLKHEKKPDIDNFIKLYLDCLDGITFDGDQKVSLGFSIKLYHPEPKTIIILQETSDYLVSQEVDQNLWLDLYGKEFGISSSFEKVSPLDLNIRPQSIHSQSFDDSSPVLITQSCAKELVAPHESELKSPVS